MPNACTATMAMSATASVIFTSAFIERRSGTAKCVTFMFGQNGNAADPGKMPIQLATVMKIKIVATSG